MAILLLLFESESLSKEMLVGETSVSVGGMEGWFPTCLGMTKQAAMNLWSRLRE